MSLGVIAKRTTFALACAGVGAACSIWGPGIWEQGKSQLATTTRPASTRPTTGPSGIPTGVDTWVVKRGDLRITFVENGKMRAVKSYPIIPSIRGQMKITFLAAEGATVKKGEQIAGFDKKNFEDALLKSQGDLEDAKRAQQVAEAGLEIAKSAAKTNVAAAETKLEDARVLLKTYTEMEGPKRLGELDKLLTETRTKLTEARKAVSESQRQIDDGLFSEEEQKKALERDLVDRQQLVRSLDKTADSVTLQRKIFRAYEYPQSLKAKRQAVDGATLEVERAKVAGVNEINQKTAEVGKVKDLIKRVEKQITENKDLIAKCEMTAPVDGLVVYGDPSERFYGRPIQVGAEWYGGQTLLTIPDLSAFTIDIELGESLIGKVKTKMPVSVTFDAVPGLSMGGEVDDIAKLGQPRERYDDNSPRVFKTAIKLNASDPRLISGMTAKVEILADYAKDLLLVPVDAVASEGGKTMVIVRTGPGKTEKREIVTGRSNNSLVEVKSGLEEGDSLALGSANPANR